MKNKILFTDLFPFGDFLGSSKFFAYLLGTDDQLEDLKIQEIPNHFEEYVHLVVGQENQILVDKIYGKLDSLLGDCNRELDNEIINCTFDRERGSHGNEHISDWAYTPRYQDLLDRKDFLEKVLNLSIFEI